MRNDITWTCVQSNSRHPVNPVSLFNIYATYRNTTIYLCGHKTTTQARPRWNAGSRAEMQCRMWQARPSRTLLAFQLRENPKRKIKRNGKKAYIRIEEIEMKTDEQTIKTKNEEMKSAVLPPEEMGEMIWKTNKIKWIQRRQKTENESK